MTTTAQALEALAALDMDYHDEFSVHHRSVATLRQHIESTAAEIARLQAECEALRRERDYARSLVDPR